MKLAIMQPYFFPYLGYFQLINAVDTFIIYDNVQFIRRGWINRNRILINGQPFMFHFSIKKDIRDKNINEIYFSDEFSYEKAKLLKTIAYNYNKAPYFMEIYQLLTKILNINETNVATMIGNSIQVLCNYIGIKTSIIYSSPIKLDSSLKGESKIIELCKYFNCDHYINAIGGVDLYSKDKFALNNIKINFIKMNNITYPQFDYEFVPNLSIIDVLMFNSTDQIQGFLKECELK